MKAERMREKGARRIAKGATASVGRPQEARIVEALWPEDLSVAKALVREYGDYVASLGFDLGFQGFEAELEGLPGRYARPSGLLLIAWRGGEPLGCVGYRGLEKTICEMKRLYVRPDIRGRGIGSLLCRDLIREARSCGYRAMRLDTADSMRSARRLYASFGFREIAPYYDNPYETIYLELDLK